MSILDTITPRDRTVLQLSEGIPVVIVGAKPDHESVESIAREVEEHVTDYRVQREYGQFNNQRGTKLSLYPTDNAMQDSFFAGYDRERQLRDPGSGLPG